MGIEYSIYTPPTRVIVLLCVHAPRGLFRVPLPYPPPLSDGNLHPAALLRMRGNYFRTYLSIFACAIEVQQNNANYPTIQSINSRILETIDNLYINNFSKNSKQTAGINITRQRMLLNSSFILTFRMLQHTSSEVTVTQTTIKFKQEN